MRDLKVRVWHDPYDEGYVMDYDYLLQNEPGFSLNEMLRSRKDFVVMQSTGLNDRHGKEIYEGDIVEYSYVKNHPRTCQIIYEPMAAAFLLQDMSRGQINYVQMKYLGDIVRGGGSTSETRTYELCEVIGNIYENSELLNPQSNHTEGK